MIDIIEQIKFLQGLKMGTDLLIFNEKQSPIYETIDQAKKFIKIVAFQMTSTRLIEVLKKRAREGIKIEVITLPVDSFKKANKRKEIEIFHEDLKKNDVVLEICDWEVGAASLTTTSQSGKIREGGGSKWYSMHGKLIITDQNALLLTANLIDKQLWDVYLSLSDEKSKALLIEGFDRIRQLFIEPSKANNEIRGKLFDNLPEVIQTDIKTMWNDSQRKNIKDYPINLAPTNEITPGLKICPFEGKARDFLTQLISESEDFCYICSERIFDEDFILMLLREKKRKPDLDIKILAGPPWNVRQNREKAEEQAIKLLSFGIDLRLIRKFHAKLWLSKKWLMVGSSNIVKMSLGFEKIQNHWRSNTEILYFSNKKTLLDQAKKEFEDFFEAVSPGLHTLAERPQNEEKAESWFELYSKKITSSAKRLLSQITIFLKVKTNINVDQIVRYSIKIATSMNDSQVNDIHVTMGYVLFELQYKAETEAELIRIFGDLLGPQRIKDAISNLKDLKLCKFYEGQLVLNLDRLLD